MPYHHKRPDNYCEFIIREKGHERAPACTVEIQNSFRREFGEQLMRELSRGAWFYDADASPRCFRILPSHLEQAIEIARQHFKSIFKIEGEKIEDIISGDTKEQPGLFGGGESA